MFCSICTKSFRAEIIEAWARSGSLRETAARFGVGYRSLQRHLDLCLASVWSEVEEWGYQKELRESADLLMLYYRIKMRKPRPKSIIKKPVEYTWSRRSWKTPKECREVEGKTF
jgi:hypothetical protein